MSRRARKKAQPTIASEIARYTHGQEVVAFLHGYFDGGASCYGIRPAECAEIRDALTVWMNANWVQSEGDNRA